MNQTDTDIVITSWNSHGFTRSTPYLNNLMDTCDVMLIQEHHLFPCQLEKLHQVNSDFDCFSRHSALLSDADLQCKQGHGGVAIMWKHSIAHCIKPQKSIGNDRICVVKLCMPSTTPVFVICVYLPQRQCTIASFTETVDHLDGIIKSCQLEGAVLVMGDTNFHLGTEKGPRCWGNTTINAQ